MKCQKIFLHKSRWFEIIDHEKLIIHIEYQINFQARTYVEPTHLKHIIICKVVFNIDSNKQDFDLKAISISTQCQFQLAMLIVIFAISNGKCYIEEAQFQITSGKEITDDLFVPSDSKNYYVLKTRVSAI